jgi:nitrous oxidase accessory protein NosD
MPCTVIAKAVATGRPYLKLKGTIEEQVTLNNQDVTLFAEPGSKLTTTSTGFLLRIGGTSQIAIYDLEISGASGAGIGFGIWLLAGATGTVTLTRVQVSGNEAGGISASGGSLTISQSTISDNIGGGILATSGTLTVSRSTIFGNRDGGIFVGTEVAFDITNCFIIRNGNSNYADIGGVYLRAFGGPSAFSFNTVVDNAVRNATGRTGASTVTSRVSSQRTISSHETSSTMFRTWTARTRSDSVRIQHQRLHLLCPG